MNTADQGERSDEQLREIREVKERLGRIEQTLRRYFAASLIHRLHTELQRCTRYNHFLCVAVFRPGEMSVGRVYERLRVATRVTDVIDVIDFDGSPPGAEGPDEAGDVAADAKRLVVILLTETGPEGGRAASARFRRELVDLRDVAAGLAAFPDDGDEPRTLIGRAFQRAV